jgi:hypothetical protein
MRKDISACYGHKSDGHRQFYGFTMPTNSMYTSFPTSSSLAFRSFAYFFCVEIENVRSYEAICEMICIFKDVIRKGKT